MGRWSDTVFDMENEPALIEAQSPVVRPDPIPRPDPIERPAPRSQMRQLPAPQPAPRRPLNAPQTMQGQPREMPPAPSVTPEAPPQRWSDGVFDLPSQPQPQQQAAPEPRKESWSEWAVNTVKGRHDPAYKGTPSFEQAMLAENNEGALTKQRLAAPFTATDTGLANIIQGSLGDRFVRQETDANGYPIIVYRGKDGQEAKAYVNRPGLDMEDVGRGIAQAVPYLMSGGLVGSALKGIGSRVVGMAGAAGLTSLGSDTTALAMGSQEAPDPVRAAIIAGAAGGLELLAPAVGAFWRKAVTEPSLYKNGALTPKGVAAARQAGLDPAQITQDLAQSFSKEFARTGDALRAGTTVQSKQFDIPISRGQLTKDPQQLLTEKGMRYGVYGDGAKDTMQTFDRTQADKIKAAAVGDGTAKLSVADKIAPGRPATQTPTAIGQEMMAGIQEAQAIAKQNEKFMWGRVGTLEATDAAKAELPNAITQRIGSLPIDETLTPKAAGMIKDLEAFVAGQTPGVQSSIIQRQAVQDVGDMRKRLLAIYRGAADSTDKAASKAVYDGFNDWIESSAQKALLSGDPASAVAMRQARDVTKEMQSIFGERGVGGSVTPGRKIIQNLLDDGTTPETIVSKLFSTDPGATPKAGTQEALQLMKRGMDRYLPPGRATEVWNDVRLAAWQKLVMKPNGDMHTPTMMAQNIDKFLRSQQTIARTLYEPADIQIIRSFGSAMREIAYKDPNPSGSGTAAALYTKQFGQALMRVLGAADGPVAKVVSALMGWSGATKAVGNVAAKTAVNGGSLPTARPLIGHYGAIGASQSDPPNIRNFLAR